jgi:hypothetical protein
MHRFSYGIIILILCFLTPFLAFAQTPESSPTASPEVVEVEAEDDHRDPITHKPNRIDPDRPHVSEAPVIVGTGTFQIEAGVLTLTSRGSEESRLTTTPTLLRYGTSPETEFRVELDMLNYQDRRLGFGDVSLGVKHVIADEGPEMAMLYRYKLNAGSNGFQSAPEPEVKFLLGFDLSDKTEVEVNLGVRSTIDPEGTRRFFQGTFACAVTHSLISHQLAIFGEIFGDGPFRPGHGGLLTAQGGFLYRFDDDTQFDVEILRGLSGTGTDWGYGFGMSARY